MNHNRMENQKMDNQKMENHKMENHKMEINGKARMSIRDFSKSLTSNESHGYVCTLIYELYY